MVNSTAYKTAPGSASGWLNGLLGVVIFSGSLPATRVAVVDIDPFFLTFLRATIAGALAMILIFGYREKRPRADQLLPLLVVSLGVVVGFPLLTAMALAARDVGAFHRLFRAAAAGHGDFRCDSRRRTTNTHFLALLWMGSLLVMGFALSQNAAVSLTGDLLMLAAVMVCGLGYAEGAKLTRVLGGWQVISWALIISLPFMLTASILTLPASLARSLLPPGWRWVMFHSSAC
ncbi:Permease of the drug/metabolite transporter (DMT) superfamily [Raoultella ornithinolytica]|nr:Permease of the drug/metabolite transporter (DMT) superfamily [Raoultella ornithinolytica]